MRPKATKQTWFANCHPGVFLSFSTMLQDTYWHKWLYM